MQYDLQVFVQDYQSYHFVVMIIEMNFENDYHMFVINVHFPKSNSND
jgi:hypothetical protein